MQLVDQRGGGGPAEPALNPPLLPPLPSPFPYLCRSIRARKLRPNGDVLVALLFPPLLSFAPFLSLLPLPFAPLLPLEVGPLKPARGSGGAL